MPLPQTEDLPDHDAVDALDSAAAAVFALSGHTAAVEAVRVALGDITLAAALMAGAIRSGGRLRYAAAGSSGLMALADACELPGTFGIASDKIRIHMAGGVPADGRMPGSTEDDVAEARSVADALSPDDVLIVLSASGSTPYAVELARLARLKESRIIAIANNPGGQLLGVADVAICLATPPEIVAGSTRLGAGTAQKVALNIMSTLMGVELGHVYRGRMVNLTADNEKLRRRSQVIVQDISGVPADLAKRALDQAGGRTKLAILIAAGHDPEAAQALLDRHAGRLAPCLSQTT